MIGKISGQLDYRAADHVLIDTGGVGYLVYCSERTLARMPGPGEAVALYTDLLVREDLLQLFGFSTLAEREWHRLLTSVQGVGAKAALSVLGTLGAEGVARALVHGDTAAIRAAPGIGPKIAQRIVLELRDKSPVPMAIGAGGAQPAVAGDVSRAEVAGPATPESARASAEALSALVNLGYAPNEAAGAVAQAGEADLGTQALIRAALKLLAPKG